MVLPYSALTGQEKQTLLCSSSRLRACEGVSAAAPAASAAAEALTAGPASLVEAAAGAADAGQQGADDEGSDGRQDQQEPPGHSTLANNVCNAKRT